MTATRRLWLVWAVLVLATGASWAIGADHGSAADTARVGTALALVVAFVKVRYVGLEFMELRGSPAALRWSFEAWVLVVGASLTALYLLG